MDHLGWGDAPSLRPLAGRCRVEARFPREASMGLIEILLLLVLPAAALLVASFILALAAFLKVRRLERRDRKPGNPF